MHLYGSYMLSNIWFSCDSGLPLLQSYKGHIFKYPFNHWIMSSMCPMLGRVPSDIFKPGFDRRCVSFFSRDSPTDWIISNECNYITKLLLQLVAKITSFRK